MARTIALIQGHPDPEGGHLGHALADAYRESAVAAGHEVTEIPVATLSFPWLRSPEDFERGGPPPAIRDAQRTIAAADHLVFVYPLWLGDVPAVLKAFLEQTFRPPFVTKARKGLSVFGARRLKGTSARLVVTMGMPARFYRLFYRAHSVRSFKRNILHFCGIRPVKVTWVGMANRPARRRNRWLRTMRRLGSRAR